MAIYGDTATPGGAVAYCTAIIRRAVIVSIVNTCQGSGTLCMVSQANQKGVAVARFTLSASSLRRLSLERARATCAACGTPDHSF